MDRCYQSNYIFIKYLTIGGEDFPFCGAALAKVLGYAI
jgi:hypothetical protein